ncbi:hypothetical protein DRJ25_02700 [Candidatus Woesearchaeota archaeon]|nr:MAG: hypothetical protein DRJ25_02700 [Candidatus Woesearchaeota archaeon]
MLNKKEKINKISQANQEVMNVLQTNKEQLLKGLQNEKMMNALNIAALSPDASNQVKDVLKAISNALKKLKGYIQTQESIVKGAFLNKLKREELLVQKAIEIVESAIPSDASLDLAEFKNIIRLLGKEFLSEKQEYSK